MQRWDDARQQACASHNNDDEYGDEGNDRGYTRGYTTCNQSEAEEGDYTRGCATGKQSETEEEGYTRGYTMDKQSGSRRGIGTWKGYGYVKPAGPTGRRREMREEWEKPLNSDGTTNAAITTTATIDDRRSDAVRGDDGDGATRTAGAGVGSATAAPYWSADTSSARHVQSSTAAKDVHWSADASSAQHDTSSSMGAVRESGPGSLRRGVTLTATGVYLGPLTLNLKVLNH